MSTSSSTGDIKNNISKLLRELKRMNMKVEPNIRGLLLGIPSAFLPILHSSLMSYSLPLAQHLASLGIELYGRSDLRFVEGLYKVLRDVFQYHPKISRTQFLSIGFAECKIILTVDLLKLCQKKHIQLSGGNPHKTHVKTKRGRSSSSMGSSFSTVHTVASSSGIGSVWQEPVSTSSSSISSKPHLPLSPPASPVQHHTNEGLVILPEPVLEVTPISTPMKTTSSSSISHSSSDSAPSLDTSHQVSFTPNPMHHAPADNTPNNPTVTGDSPSSLDSATSHDKEIDISNMLNDHDDVEIVTVESDTKLDSGEVQPLDNNEATMVCINEVSKRIEHTMELLDKLTHRMTSAESQLKMLQDKGMKVSSRDVAIQTDPPSPPLPSSHDSTIPPPPLISSPGEGTSNGIQSSSTRHRHYSSSSTSSSDTATPPPSPVKINFDCPINEEDTMKILTNLRTRAQQTKELLNKANHLTPTNLLINPVN